MIGMGISLDIPCFSMDYILTVARIKTKRRERVAPFFALAEP
jgi:hypothetical protein